MITNNAWHDRANTMTARSHTITIIINEMISVLLPLKKMCEHIMKNREQKFIAHKFTPLKMI